MLGPGVKLGKCLLIIKHWSGHLNPQIIHVGMKINTGETSDLHLFTQRVTCPVDITQHKSL